MNQEIRERTKWFMDARFGMFIHWGLYSIPACGEWVMSEKEMTVEEYRTYFEQFDPVDYDPKKWVRLSKEAGMKYVVLTAKHHDGFCLEHPKAVEDGLVYAVTDQADSEHVLKELKKGPYGRCVFHSDNTVVDHQTVDIEFENQVTASFLMTAFTNQCARRIRIMGTKGELKGDMEAGTIEIIDFVSGTNELIQLHTPSKGHSGSDMSMMREFVRMVGEGKTGKTDASVSVASHLMALAAEEARIRKTVIDFEEYSAYETK